MTINDVKNMIDKKMDAINVIEKSNTINPYARLNTMKAAHIAVKIRYWLAFLM